ncbi:hypothetical protein HR060_16480 [Catenovulum sp. SM1970]|uniref:hypothetical protein n=1 Tax=Marinifaba aquimaris TaxID=2741323 RepID=UPI00157259B6|nr:hypothetical protein [Marinifaba aquimaris]NTS78447.1 hypothetical protein [Marinifaba aquimaris]
MNSVVRIQALTLPNMDCRFDDTQAHMFLEKMLLPLDVQDQILAAINSRSTSSLEQLAYEIEMAMESHIPEFLGH